MRITVLDTETTLHGDREGDLANPHDPNNNIVWFGVQRLLNGTEGPVHTISHENVDYQKICEYTSTEMMVGANIKFDITQIRKNVDDAAWYDWLRDGGEIWDVQLAEYLLTGQQDKMTSLDKLSIKYGLPLKDNKMKEYWKKGVSTEDIPEEEILPYLVQDVSNTREIFYAQVKKAKELNMLPLIKTQMDALLCSQEMEANGMHVDDDIVRTLIMRKEVATSILKSDIMLRVRDAVKDEVYEQFNINSNAHLAHLFFGTDITLKIDTDTGEVYKSGIRKGLKKTKKISTIYSNTNHTTIKPLTTPSGKVKVDVSIIEQLASKSNRSTSLRRIAESLLRYKKIEKELSTYLNPIINLKWNHDNCIHHTLNQTITSTGRFSSSKPNLQNVPREGTADVKKVFTSRYPNGKIIEIDFSQLEVIALAHLSQDKQLLYDVSHGVDMHLENASVIFGIPKSKVTKEQRRKAKVATFQLQYGAGARTMHEQSGLTMTQAQDLIKAYYKRYPAIKELHKKIAREVNLTRKGTRRLTPNGFPSGTGTYVSDTGRRYIFQEYDAPTWIRGKDVGFSPTEMKNYPVQGFATADIVPMMLGKVLKNVMTNPAYSSGVKIINTVHDSLLFDCDSYLVPQFLEDVTIELKRTNEYLLDIFGITVDVDFAFDIEIGDSWGTTKKV